MKEFCEAFGAWCAENGYSGDHLVTLVESSENWRKSPNSISTAI